MKKLFAVALVAVCVVSLNVFGGSRLLSPVPTASGGIYAIDVALRTAADQISRRYQEDSKVVMLNITSPTDAFSEYALNGLTGNFRRQNVVSASDVERARAARRLSVSGQIPENVVREIGNALGAHLVVTGFYSAAGNRGHNVVIQVLDVASGNIEVRHRMDFRDDAQVQRLLTPAAPAPAPAPQVAQTPPPPPPPAPAPRVEPAPANGTYTFHPRLRPYRGANVEQGVYIPKIVVRGEYMSIFFCADSVGAITNGARGTWMAGYNQSRNIVLTNLDNPSQTWNPELGMAGAAHWDNSGGWMTFKGVTARRFSLTDNYGNVRGTFEEIILNTPDQ